VLPGLVEDAQRTVQRLWRLETEGDPTLLDPLTGALQPAATRRLVERAAAGDVLVGVAVDHDGAVAATDGRARSDVLVRDLATVVQGELDVDERLGRLEGPGVVALLPHPDADRADHLVTRVRERWSRLDHGGRHVPLGVAVRTLGDRRLADLQAVTDTLGLGGARTAGAG
jgi:GGDEF domain-containing protein